MKLVTSAVGIDHETPHLLIVIPLNLSQSKKNSIILKFLKRYEERLKNVFQFTLEARVSFAIVLRIVLPANMELHSNLGFLFKYGKN